MNSSASLLWWHFCRCGISSIFFLKLIRSITNLPTYSVQQGLLIFRYWLAVSKIQHWSQKRLWEIVSMPSWFNGNTGMHGDPWRFHSCGSLNPWIQRNAPSPWRWSKCCSPHHLRDFWTLWPLPDSKDSLDMLPLPLEIGKHFLLDGRWSLEGGDKDLAGIFAELSTFLALSTILPAPATCLLHPLLSFPSPWASCSRLLFPLA